MNKNNIFTPINNEAPPRNIPRFEDHPVPRQGIINNNSGPIQTNKFYANLFLGSQSHTAWSHPYSVWCNPTGGLCISHIERSQVTVQPLSDRPSSSAASRYYLNPTFIRSMLLTASELGNETHLTIDSPKAFSVNVNFQPIAEDSWTRIQFPLVQGMAYVTAKYFNATPLIQSGVFFRTFTGPALVDSATTPGYGATYRYLVVLEDGRTWIIYLTPSQPYDALSLKLLDNSSITGNPHFSGLIQVAKCPITRSSEAIATFDKSAGAYPQSADISATIDGLIASYSLSWSKQGVVSKPLLMFALPHHVQGMDVATLQARTNVQLQTTTKGVATAFQADKLIFTMIESNLPIGMGFAPWAPTTQKISNVSNEVGAQISNAAQTELAQDMNSQTNLNSMYFSGKALAKFAMVTYATHDLARNPAVARLGLRKLKSAFNVFVQNMQPLPLVYDVAWKGIVSSGGYEDMNLDFGNTYYNDHHFHYSYFVYTAAVIAYLDPDWLKEGTNKSWVQMLVKDYANSVNDNHFPFSRSFDWFHGHSWAKGLFESADGKDQESSSEDVFASYALKMWGYVIGDKNMEARGNLMLSIQSRSNDNYYLMRTSNINHPPSFIGNKVVGILFENKCDYATYFGLNKEYIHGIHMIPLTPASTFVRRPDFVEEEWDAIFEGKLQDVEGGWRGILMANLAVINPSKAYEFFSDPSFDDRWLDGGASKTWYLAWAAALGGV